MSTLDDTIVALATAPGPGARAVVRLSGSHAHSTVSGVFSPMPAGRGLATGSIALPGLHSPLSADVYYMPGPHSYTGQDCVELHVISSPPLVDLLIATLLDRGARAARAGEFTMRAFLSGKKDLTQAEAVLGVIEADSDEDLKQSLAQLAGGLTQPLHGLRDDLLNLLADVEAGLDFSAEDLQFVDNKDILLRLGAGMAHLINLQKKLENRSVNTQSFRVALAGAPNAGKSSLFNALSGMSAAIVSPIPGTTRDYLTRTVTIQGTNVELIDTAGLRSPADSLEDQAQRFGRLQAVQADLIIWCVEASQWRPGQAMTGDFAVAMTVLTKVDVGEVAAPHPATSAMTGRGITELRHILAARAREKRAPALAPSLSRCRHHIDSCLGHLRSAHHAVLFVEPAEILALELRLAVDQLGEMVGAIYTDDLLDRVFSRFCIGK